MQVEWDGRRRQVRCYLADILVLLAETGRRIGAVRQVTVGDLRLHERPGATPSGLSPRHVHELCRLGVVSARTVRGRWRVHRADFTPWIGGR